MRGGGEEGEGERRVGREEDERRGRGGERRGRGGGGEGKRRGTRHERLILPHQVWPATNRKYANRECGAFIRPSSLSAVGGVVLMSQHHHPFAQNSTHKHMYTNTHTHIQTHTSVYGAQNMSLQPG